MRPGCSPRRPLSIFFHIAAPLACSLSPPAAPFAHPRPPCPPTGHPQKLVYWLWIAAIFYLEQKIVIKQGALLKPYELKVIGNEFLWRTKILHVVTHVLIDGFTLINLNCMFPRWGIKYPNGRRRAPVLRMSEETVVTIRHVCKLMLRIPKLNAAILGARPGCHHGYTLIQAMTMSISPSLFGVILAVESKRWLACVGASNVFFMVNTALQLPTAYGYDEHLRAMYLSSEEDSPSKLMRIGVPCVFIMPFVINEMVRNEFVSKYGAWYARLNQQVLLGGDRTQARGGEHRDAKVSLVRMQFASTVAIGFVAIANVNAVLSMISNAPTREMVPVAPLVAALMQFLLPSYLTARHLSSTWERHFRHGFIRAAAFTRVTLTLSFAAMSAIFFIACHRASGSASGFDLWRLWLPKWLFVVACSYAAVPAPNAACALAGVLADLLAAKAAFFYLATPGTPEMDQKTQLYTCAGMYLASLHLFHVSNFLYKTAVSRLGLRAENTSTPETTRAATSDPLDHNFPSDHWKMEDYEIDPVKFKLVPKRSDRVRSDADRDGYDFGPMQYPLGGSPQKGRSLSAVEESDEDGVAESVHTLRCRAQGCKNDVNATNIVTTGLRLCSEHLVSKIPFTTTGSQSMFCLACRRVHSPPRCEACLVTRDQPRDGATFTRDEAGDSKPGVPADFQNVEQMTMYFKTEEGPVRAVSRFRAVVDDFSERVIGDVMHAEVAARPGCTLLTVDVLSRPDADAESRVDDCAHEDLGDDGISRSLEAHAADSIHKLRSIGATHGLEGNLAFIVGHPLKGRSRTHTVEFGPGGAIQRTAPLSSGADAFLEPIFSPALVEAIRRSHDPATRMTVIRSDRYDCINLPKTPEGYAYTLRCHGRYVPLLVATPCELSPQDQNRTIPRGHELFRITPNNIEGIGFIELVMSDATAYTAGGDDRGPVGGGNLPARIAPVMCVPVFITPDALLASELGRSIGRFAQLGDSPVLFNLGVALNAPSDQPRVHHSGSASFGSDSSGGSRGSQQRLAEVCFHAATACAALGWAAATFRVLAAQEPRSNVRDSPARDTALMGSHGISSMSEGPDTSDYSDRYMSTDPSDIDVYEDEAYFGNSGGGGGGRRKKKTDAMLFSTINNNAGIATVLRAACTSGDSNTVNAVIAAMIRHRSATAVGAILSLGDNIGSGKGWTPLHACAFAMARAACAPPRRGFYAIFGDISRQNAINEALDATLSALVASNDPLAWVTGNAGMVVGTPARVSCTPPDTVAHAYSYGSSPHNRRQQHSMETASEKVVTVLAQAVVMACEWLHRARVLAARDLVDAVRVASDEREHFRAAMSLAAKEYDGSPVNTIASGLLLSSSSHLWEAMRCRVVDEHLRGALGLAEAKEWVRAGAPRTGFPLLPVSALVSGRHGVKSLAWMDVFVAFVCIAAHKLGWCGAEMATTAFGIAVVMIIAAALSSPPITPRRGYLRSHRIINCAARLLFAALHFPIMQDFLPKATMAYETRTTVRIVLLCAQYVLGSLYAPVGHNAEPAVVGAQALLFPGTGLAAEYLAAFTAGDATRLAEFDAVLAEFIVFVVAACGAACVASSSFGEHVARRCLDKQFLREWNLSRGRGGGVNA